ncbi:hypothetical protein FS320_30000 [Microvirga tunisiensis]|uniref:Glycine zipper domain-containing protein n=1 Tax=Microvirga tunisiensis TaxID=2108360 RepID=A0A5N7MRD1_9HYPH|nr:hypothetical protein [Microvirga tunisiensis]MPR29220.1 hypothetical protein [Microvirga tunisiensis]
MRVEMKYAVLATAFLLPSIAIADPGGAAAGAAAGGAAGAVVGGPVGAAVGAGVGGATGARQQRNKLPTQQAPRPNSKPTAEDIPGRRCKLLHRLLTGGRLHLG